ncbi:MAG: GGDEF domain-containing protein, partial [Chloroflexota bacterium]|nr:GGDEF domain-containing protein [Chloroflexota bacterium]
GLKNHYALDCDLVRLSTRRVSFSFVYFDLDGFKQVNDRLGHRAGDEILAETAAILTSLDDVVPYHLHGDEFAFLLPGHDDAKIEALARRVFEQLHDLGARRGVALGATFGAAQNADTATSPDDVRHAADGLMRRAKDAGKHRLALASGPVLTLADDAG